MATIEMVLKLCNDRAVSLEGAIGHAYSVPEVDLTFAKYLEGRLDELTDTIEAIEALDTQNREETP